MSHDPRFLRSRTGVARSGRRKTRSFRFIVALGLFFVLLGAGLTFVAYTYFTAPDRFIVEDIEVHGTVFADADEIKRAVQETLQGNMLMADLQQVCRHVETLPWVRRVKAGKVLPRTLKLSIAENRPRASAVIEGEIWLIDSQGALIDRLRPEHPYTGLPLVTPINGASETMRDQQVREGTELLEDIRLHRPDWHERISEVAFSSRQIRCIYLRDVPVPIYIDEGDPIPQLGKFFMIEANLKGSYDSAKYFDARFDRRLIVKKTGE